MVFSGPAAPIMDSYHLWKFSRQYPHEQVTNRMVEEIGDRPPSVRENQRSSSVVENILEISSEVTRAPSLEEEGVSRRRTTVVAEL